jgi:hypothetical protein
VNTDEADNPIGARVSLVLATTEKEGGLVSSDIVDDIDEAVGERVRVGVGVLPIVRESVSILTFNRSLVLVLVLDENEGRVETTCA